jgi:carboxyl-terminal processing protease
VGYQRSVSWRHRWFILTQSAAVANTDTEGFAQPEQKITTRQVAALLDRSHYLNQPLDSKMGSEILFM